MCGFCNVWACACVGFLMCGCFNNRVDVLVIRVFVFIVFFYCFVYVYLLLFVTSVRTTATE
jgi:predicted membrane channel-forming protein YqfA (hemolysin III family)